MLAGPNGMHSFELKIFDGRV